MPGDADVERLAALAGPVTAAIAARALNGDQQARWELAQRHAMAPGSPAGRLIEHLLPAISRDVPPVTAPVTLQAPVPARPMRSHQGLQRVAPLAAPDVGVRLDSAKDGELNVAPGPFGHGAYFTSGADASQEGGRARHAHPAGVRLAGADLYRLRDSTDGHMLQATLADVDRAVSGDGDLEQLAQRLPAGADGRRDIDRALTILQARPTGTEAMQGLGYDGVDARHLPDWDTQETGSVLYEARTGDFDVQSDIAPTHLVDAAGAQDFLADPPPGGWAGIAHHATTPEAANAILAGGFESGHEIHATPGASDEPGVQLAVRLENPARELGDGRQNHDGAVTDAGVVAFTPDAVRVIEPTMPSPGAGGAVVAGRAGRWVWIRGSYRHIPHAAAWEETADGVTFNSPENSTFVYRRVGNAPAELVAKPRWNGHPDVRNPNRGGTARGATITAPPPPAAPEPPAPPSPEGVDLPEPGWQVRVTPADGSAAYTAIVQRVEDDRRTVRVELANGEHRNVPAASLEVTDRGLPTPQIGPLISEEGWNAVINRAGIPQADGELTPGIYFQRGLPHPMSPAQIEHAVIVGPQFFASTPDGRAFQLRRGLGFGLFEAIHRDDLARQTVSNLWTNGKFTGEHEGRSTSLDRFSTAEGVAQAYARLLGPEWDKDAAIWPDVMRRVALEAHDRGYEMPGDRVQWALGADIGGPGVRPPATEGQRLAERINGQSDGEARDLLNAEGFHSTAGYSARTAVYRKFVDGKVITVAWLRSSTDPVADAQGTDYEFDPAVQPDPADATAVLAHRLRGMSMVDARAQLDDWTLVSFSRPYGGIQREGYAKGDRIIWLSTTGTYTPQSLVTDVRPDFADANTVHELRQRALAQNPGDATVTDQPADLVRAANRGGWQIVQGGAATDEWWTLEKVSNPNSDAVTVEQWRYRLQDGRLSEVGRPSEADAGFGTDLGYQVTAARRAEELRTQHREQRARIDTLKEQIRTRVNAAGEPFNGREDFADVRLALRELGYVAGNPRDLQGGAQSVTYKNAERGAKLIVRVGPEANGTRIVQARTRVEAGRTPDLGRARVTGRVPISQAEYHADMLGRADELGARHPSARVDLRRVTFATTAREPAGLSDHAGWHRSVDGHIMLGKDAWPDLQRLIASRNAGHELTLGEKRRVYATYQLMQHEVGHAVYTGRMGYTDGDGGRGMEEALNEELSHVETLDWLRSHGLDEVVDEARRSHQNPTAVWPWRGTYLTDRQNLRGLLERAGAPDDPEERLAMFRRWKFEMSGEERKRELAGMIARREGIPEDAALLLVRRRMAGDVRAGTRDVRGFRAILTPPGFSNANIGREALERRGYVRGSGIVSPEGQIGTIVGYSGPGPMLEVRLEGAVNTRRIQLAEVEGRWRLTGPAPDPPPPPRPDPPPPTAPTDAPTDAPTSTLRLRDRVRVTPVRGRAFQGRIIEVGTGDRAGYVKVKKIGRGEEVWAPERHTRRLDGTGGPPPPPGDTTPPPGPPPAQARTATLQNGGKVTAGAKVRGRVSRQLSTVLNVSNDGTRVGIRRADGSEYVARADELDAVVITNEGRELKMGDRVLLPGGGRHEDGGIQAIDWTDPQAPKVQIGGVGRRGEWVDARTLRPSTDQGVPLPLVTVDGQSFQIGDRARNRHGQLVEITGQRALRWPEPKAAITFRVIDTGVEDSIEDSPGALREIGQAPTVPSNVRPPSSLVERLGNQHYRRQGAGRNTAQAVAKPISEAIAADLEEWWGAKGLPTRRPGGSDRGTAKRPVYRGRATPPDAVFANLYRDLFTSEAEHDAARDSNPQLYEMAKGLAAQARLPWPNWQERVPPAPPAPPTPEGTMFDEAVLRHAWTGTFGGRGYTTRLTAVRSGRTTGSVAGEILTPNGTKVGEFSRSVSLNAAGEPHVYHSFLKIHKRYRGGGFATMFNRHAESVYRAKGVKAVTVSANIDVGGYAWAATGFDWNLEPEGTPEAKAKARARKARSMFQAAQYGLTAEQRALVEAKLWDGVGPLEAHHIQHAWQLAHLGPGHEIGKKIMLGSSWSGIKHLVGPERSPFAG